MTQLRRIVWSACLLPLVATLMGAGAVNAQSPAEWPQRSVKFILPLGPGSGVDVVARMIADKLSTRWGKPVVVENRPGGDSFVAITGVLSANDDHTLLFSPASSFTAHAYLHQKLPYDPKDLVPAARVSNTIVTLAVPAALNINSVKELVDLVRAKPGELNWATATGANDLLFAAFLKNQDLKMAKVPYRDTVQAINDLTEGRIHAYIAAYAIVRAQVQAGKVKVIALTNRRPAPALANVPTAAAAGFPLLTLDGLVGIFGTSKLAPNVREKIAADVKETLADPAISGRIAASGQVVSPGSAAEFAAEIQLQRDDVAAIGKALGIAAAK